MCTLSFKRIEFRRVNVQNCDERMHVNSPSHFSKVTALMKAEAYNHGIHSNLWCVKKMSYVPPQLLLESIEM